MKYILISAIFFLYPILLFCSEFNCRSIYNSVDVTKDLQNAINSGAKKIIIPNMNSKWITGPLFVEQKENIEIVLEKGVIIESKSGAFTDLDASIINIIKSKNIKIIGDGAEIQMLKKEYFNGQWRHGIKLISSDSVYISGLIISRTGGDGIYIGSNNSVIPCSNIFIKNITANENARNGLSVISCLNLLIENCTFSRTGYENNPHVARNGPWAGIDFEPNHSYEKLENIKIINCSFEKNKNYGILYAHGCETSSITISDCYFWDNQISGIHFIGLSNTLWGNINILNNKIFGLQLYAIQFIDWNLTNFQIRFFNNKIDCKDLMKPVRFLVNRKKYLIQEFGNIQIDSTQISNYITNNRCILQLEGPNTVTFKNIKLNGKINNESFYGELNDMKLSDNEIPTNINFPICEITDEIKIKTFPNPFTDEINIETDTYNEVEFSIINLKGQIIYIKLDYGKCHIKGINLNPGMYILKARDLKNGCYNTVYIAKHR